MDGTNSRRRIYLKETQYLETHFAHIDANLPFENNDTIMSIASKLATLKKESIDDTLSLVTHDELQKAVGISFARVRAFASLPSVTSD